MPHYFLSPQAQESLRQISVYTLENYGAKQKTKYLKMLRSKMRIAAKNPAKGRERSDVKQGYYSIQAEKHHIYYRIRNTHIEILDVLHQSMEPKRHLSFQRG
ncbi:MAG: type II toxin-antitoxin system RelE/ParE family toxin [Gammaproteobacteria bacterium]